MLVEALVLDRDRRVLEDLRHAVAGDRAAQVVGGDEAEPRAVGGEHLGVGAGVALLERPRSAARTRRSTPPRRPQTGRRRRSR